MNTLIFIGIVVVAFLAIWFIANRALATEPGALKWTVIVAGVVAILIILGALLGWFATPVFIDGGMRGPVIK